MSYVEIQITQESHWSGCIKSDRSKWVVPSQKNPLNHFIPSQTSDTAWQHMCLLPVPCQFMFTFSLHTGINEASRVMWPYRLGCRPRCVSVWVCQASAWFSLHSLCQFLPCRTCEHTSFLWTYIIPVNTHHTCEHTYSWYDPAASNQITMFNYQLNKCSVKIYQIFKWRAWAAYLSQSLSNSASDILKPMRLRTLRSSGLSMWIVPSGSDRGIMSIMSCTLKHTKQLLIVFHLLSL